MPSFAGMACLAGGREDDAASTVPAVDRGRARVGLHFRDRLAAESAAPVRQETGGAGSRVRFAQMSGVAGWREDGRSSTASRDDHDGNDTPMTQR